ncbi:MAG: hypothetical protein Q8918_11985 [Bacteroidota bacterium]|nr:hypothetical protein [Bacteroidota bacterium]MDP4250820.1 hypothetical protein [Bacteroidota bacterium]
MPGNLNHLPVNWIDGMKISRKHLEETGRYLEERVRDAGALQMTGYNFGILPAEKSMDLSVFCDAGLNIQIELNSCKAITSEGSRIQILPADHPLKVVTNFKDIIARSGLPMAQSHTLLIVLSTNPFRRLPTGEPDMEENPPRHPYTKPECRIDLFLADELNINQLADCLVIGRIAFQQGELQVQKDFIPACTVMNSLPSLTGWYQKFRQALESWEQYCMKIVQKINSKPPTQQTNVLAGSIQKLSEKMLEQLVKQKIQYQWILGKSAPIHLCVSLLENLQYLQTIQQCFAEKDREEMLNYIAEWTESQAGTIENQTRRVLQITYSHYDVAQTLGEIFQAYQFCIQIFQKLSQLEFIGKKKGQGIFVIEQEVKENKPVQPNPVQKPGGRWSPLT